MRTYAYHGNTIVAYINGNAVMPAGHANHICGCTHAHASLSRMLSGAYIYVHATCHVPLHAQASPATVRFRDTWQASPSHIGYRVCGMHLARCSMHAYNASLFH